MRWDSCSHCGFGDGQIWDCMHGITKWWIFECSLQMESEKKERTSQSGQGNEDSRTDRSLVRGSGWWAIWGGLIRCRDLKNKRCFVSSGNWQGAGKTRYAWLTWFGLFELASIEIVANSLLTHICSYHLNTALPSLTILMNTWSTFINVPQILEVTPGHLIGDTWQSGKNLR